jgi:teichuronic acid biosynthesis glycosyltransferase TuaC
MIRLCVLTTLYPNSVNRRHGIFVHTRLKQLIASGEVSAQVIAPVPWFPISSKRFGRYAEWAKVPRKEVIDGIEIDHPRYLIIPKVGMLLTPLFLALAFLKVVWSRRREIDVLDAHYYYPDGVAAALVKKWLKKPLVISARGTDINVIAGMKGSGAMVRWASRIAKRSIAVSQSLADTMQRRGLCDDRIAVLRNGVDRGVFKPTEGFTWPHSEKGLKLLSVGNLTELKGHRYMIEALVQIPEASLVIVGHGEEQASLEALAKELGVQARLTFLPPVPQEALAAIYTAADLFILASSREGWPNVLLESLACNTQVISTDVGGVSEILSVPEHGGLIPERSAKGITQAVTAAKEYVGIDQQAYVESFTWDHVVREQARLYQEVIRS